MNDRETMLEMLRRAKISFTQHQYEKSMNDVIQIEAGYIGFVSEILFNESGELISIKAYD